MPSSHPAFSHHLGAWSDSAGSGEVTGPQIQGSCCIPASRGQQSLRNRPKLIRATTLLSSHLIKASTLHATTDKRPNGSNLPQKQHIPTNSVVCRPLLPCTGLSACSALVPTPDTARGAAHMMGVWRAAGRGTVRCEEAPVHGAPQ